MYQGYSLYTELPDVCNYYCWIDDQWPTMTDDADTLKFLETRAALFVDVLAHARELTAIFHHHSPTDHKELDWNKCQNVMCRTTVDLMAKAAHGLGD